MAESSEYYTRLEVRQKVEDMIIFATPFLKQIPRIDRMLRDTIEAEMYLLLKLCITAESGYKYKTTLQEIDVSQKTIRRYILLAQTEKILSMRHYKSWSEKMVEIGKMVGGLLEAVRQPAQHR